MFFGRNGVFKLQYPKEKNTFLMQRLILQDTYRRLSKLHSTTVQVRQWETTIKEYSMQWFELSLFQSICHPSLLIIFCLAREEFSRVLFFPYTSLSSLFFYLQASGCGLKSYLASIYGGPLDVKKKRIQQISVSNYTKGSVTVVLTAFVRFCLASDPTHCQ